MKTGIYTRYTFIRKNDSYWLDLDNDHSAVDELEVNEDVIKIVDEDGRTIWER